MSSQIRTMDWWSPQKRTLLHKRSSQSIYDRIITAAAPPSSPPPKEFWILHDTIPHTLAGWGTVYVLTKLGAIL